VFFAAYLLLYRDIYSVQMEQMYQNLTCWRTWIIYWYPKMLGRNW